MSSTLSCIKQLSRSETLFMILISILLGIIGGVVKRPFISIISSIFLIALFGIYILILSRNDGIWSGMIAGILIGIAIAGMSLLLRGKIDSPLHGALFGLTRGAIFGAGAGLITRAKPDSNDLIMTKLFLLFGSIFLGGFLGLVVGLISGSLLGLIHSSSWGWIITAVLGIIIGGYLSTHYQHPYRVPIGITLGSILALISYVSGGALSGIILGIFSGALVPMLLVALIGAYGGLASRGFIAMLQEAIEAPSEMINHGAVSFLLPAMLIGLIIGTTATGLSALLILPTGLAIIGIILGIIGNLSGHDKKQRITIRKIIEMIILGGDEWPIRQIATQPITQQHRQFTTAGLITGIFIGSIGSLAGIFLVTLIQNL